MLIKSGISVKPLKFKSLLQCFFVISVVVAQAQSGSVEALRQLSQRYPDSAMVLLKQQYNEALNGGEKEQEGLCLLQIGWVCFSQGQYKLALQYYLDAEKIFVDLDNPALLAMNLNDIGVFYYYNKQKTAARAYYDKALALYEKGRNLKGIAETSANIGQLFEKSEEYDSAIYYQRLALGNYNSLNNIKGSAKVHENLGSIYEDLANYDSASFYFNKSLLIYQEEKNEIGSIEVINNLGDILRKTGRYTESILKTREAYRLAQSLGNNYQLSATARDLGKTFVLMGQMDSAYHYAELSRRQTMAIYALDGIKQASFLQALYDMNKKSEEISELQANRKLNHMITVAALIVLILLVILSITFYSRQRLRIKEQSAEARQKKIESELMASTLKNQQLEEEKLKQQLDLKSKELSSHTLHLIRNNQFLEHLKSTLQLIIKDERRDQKRPLQKLIGEINESFAQDEYWKEFTSAFVQIHQSFFDRLKGTGKDLTATDIRLIALLKINLSSADISTLLAITPDSLRVARYRLRKKLEIPQGENLSAFIQAI